MRLAEGLQLKVYELFGYEPGLTMTEIKKTPLRRQTGQQGETGFGGGLEGGARLEIDTQNKRWPKQASS